jgi:multiple sugar transport system substrate-binding protein
LSVLGLFKGKAKILISSWGDPPENRILQQLIDDFQKSHPPIQVELEAIPYGEYLTQLITQFESGKAPDVVFVSSLSIADFHRRGLLEPLTPYAQSDPSVHLDAFYPTTIKWFTILGDLYVMPRDVAPVCVIYYNKMAFDQAHLPYPKDDWTIDDFLKTALKLTKRDAQGNTIQWGIVEDYPVPENWIYAFGGHFVDDPHFPKYYKVDQPEFLKGVQYRADLMNKHKVMPTLSDLSHTGAVSPTEMFTRGMTAMFLSGVWKTPLFREIKDFSWDITLSPRVPWIPKTVIGGSSGYGIASTSHHKKEAWELIAFLSGPEGQKELASTGLVQPALEAVADSGAFLDGKDPKNKKFLLKIPDTALDDPMATNWLDVKRGIIFPGLDKVWSGEETAQRAIANISVELTKHPLKFDAKPGKKP